MFAALARFVRVLRWPGFPHRCQHCGAPLKLAVTWHPSGPVYASPDGHYACRIDGRPLRHKPLPIVGGRP